MMSDTHLLRQMVNERLAVAAEEIFGLVEKTIAEYQDEVFRCRSEVIALKRQMEQLSVLKPEVQLLKIDVQECALDLPDQNPTLENSDTPDHEQAEEEQLDICSSSYLEEPDCYEDYQVPLSDADLTCPTITVSTMSFKDEEKWNEMDNSFSPSSDPTYSDIPFTAKKPAQRDKMKKKPVQKDKMKRSPIQKNQNKACRFCHICFQTNAELTRHMDTNHKGEKAFKCSQCDRGFDQEYQLAVHVRVHTVLDLEYPCPNQYTGGDIVRDKQDMMDNIQDRLFDRGSLPLSNGLLTLQVAANICGSWIWDGSESSSLLHIPLNISSLH